MHGLRGGAVVGDRFGEMLGRARRGGGVELAGAREHGGPRRRRRRRRGAWGGLGAENGAVLASSQLFGSAAADIAFASDGDTLYAATVRGGTNALGALLHMNLDGSGYGVDYSFAGAPTDGAALQGRLSVDQAVRFLEKKEMPRHVGPRILIVDSGNINSFPVDASLAPPTFQATFKVE